ncbi:MAG: hypothetical protein GXP45_04140 [bacterium]|nr:hypothetical protein [bacterium]
MLLDSVFVFRGGFVFGYFFVRTGLEEVFFLELVFLEVVDDFLSLCGIQVLGDLCEVALLVG